MANRSRDTTGSHAKLRLAPEPEQPPADISEEIRVRLSATLAWTVYRPDVEPMWKRIRAETRSLLDSYWHRGQLVGTTQAEAFYVRCDRTTMTQNDIDNGRLIVIIGVATERPAEFTILEITQQLEPRDDSPSRLFPFAFPRLPAR